MGNSTSPFAMACFSNAVVSANRTAQLMYGNATNGIYYISVKPGNTSHFSNLTDRDIIFNFSGPQNSGTAYLAFILRVDSLTATATEGYSIYLDEAGGSTNFNIILYIKKG